MNKNKLSILKIIFGISLVAIFLIIINFKKIVAKDIKVSSEDIKEKNLIEENIMVVEKTEESNIENKIVDSQKNNRNTNENMVETEKKETAGSSKKQDKKFGNNVAFIGDSRTQAFLLYSGLKDVTDYTNIGLMVDSAITKKFVKNKKGEKVTILEDLKNKNIDTVYIMLGINELGWVYSSIFIQKYEELIDKIKQTKPNIDIIVQSIIPVTKTKSDNDKVFNNTRIKEYNNLLKDLAKRKQVQYLDLEKELTDNNGYLPEEASSDGIHLNKEYCLKWLKCL